MVKLLEITDKTIQPEELGLLLLNPFRMPLSGNLIGGCSKVHFIFMPFRHSGKKQIPALNVFNILSLQ